MWCRRSEGQCVQTLNVGPFDDEGPVLAKLHDEFLSAHGLRPTDTHHEIYVSDFRKVALTKLRTLLSSARRPSVSVGASRGGHLHAHGKSVGK